jgi:ligand-binding SRPBCC domain-containing protein
MQTFQSSFTVRASLEGVAKFHHDTHALKVLSPPPIFVQLHRVEPLAEGSISEFTLWFGPLPVRWKARHQDVNALHGFTDVQISGPMKHWVHTHTFTDLGNGQVRVNDHVEYEHHSELRGLFSRLLFAPVFLNFLFFYRELATRRAVEAE